MSLVSQQEVSFMKQRGTKVIDIRPAAGVLHAARSTQALTRSSASWVQSTTKLTCRTQ